MLVLLSEVQPLGSATEPIAVNIVTPEEAEPERADPPATPAETPQLTLPDAPAVQPPPAPSPAPPPKAASPAASKPPGAAQQAAAAPAARPDQRSAAASQPTAPAQPASPMGVYRPAEPDLSVKYNVMLGLPPELPVMANARKSEEGFDESTTNADIPSSVIAQFRRHLKSCSKLPASVQPTDRIVVKLRVFMAQDGRLAGEPAIGGGSANVKAIELLQSAIAGLKQCQPYRMLPADRYGEWKVLDLDFTPKDFSS